MVLKHIVRVGDKEATFVSNTKASNICLSIKLLLILIKVVFHFRTFRVGDGKSSKDLLVDDTRQIGNGPFELIIGRSFKLKIWEELVRGMLVNEIARFTCEPEVSL